MYLKSIEVHGFKSFANRMNFEFHNGITGIVGPNGSGKSNVVDAVRWVFGEQSARQLRGGNMQDVIFAGTEHRRPQSFAEVAITMDNSDRHIDIDYEEVKITRRLYRSGESEYLINDHAARLKDINALFYDTGIGKEGYSIIGQNQIEKILSGKAEDRRELFDEAVGIVKFKRRKTQAVKKLEGEQQNLDRISDILHELTSRLGPLQKQSENAKVYLKKRDELKALDINLFLNETQETEDTLKDLTEKENLVSAELLETQKQYEEVRAEYDTLEEEIEALDARISETHEEGEKENLLRQELKGRIGILKEQIRTAMVNDEHDTVRRQAIAQEIEKRQADIASEDEASSRLSLELSALQKTENERRAELSAIDSSLTENAGALEKTQGAEIDLLNDRASIKGKLQRYETMLEQIDIRKAEIIRRSLHFREEEVEATGVLEKAKAEKEAVSSEISDIKKRTEEAEAQVAAYQDKLTEANRRMDETQASFHRDSSKLESLKNLEEHYDGYGNGIRRVMEEKPNEPGIVGVVAELLTVDKKYEVAIETALGSKTRNIVTGDEQTAKRLINFLKKNRLGRATFLPLTSIQSPRRFEPQAALQETGVIGLASTLVKTDPGYEVLPGYLLGRTLVIDNIDHALAIGKKYRHGLNMVTLQGELFTPGGAITGGAFKSTSTLLGRRREIEELEGTTKKLMAESEALAKEIESARNHRNYFRNEIVKLHEELQAASIRLNTADMTMRQAQDRLNDNKLSASALDDENKEIANQIAQVNDNRAALDADLKGSFGNEETLTEQARLLEEQAVELQKERQAKAEALREVQLKTQALSQQIAFGRSNVRRLTDEIKAFEAEDKELEANRNEISGSVEERQAKIRETEDQIRSAEERYEALREAERELIDKKADLSLKHKGFFDRREALSGDISRLDKEEVRLTSRMERLNEDREKKAAYLWEEYELTPSQARELEDAELRERTTLKKDVSGLKDEIKALGPVNVNAIEEYKEVSERHDFLSAQHEDLVQSIATINGIISELDTGMQKQFHEQFGKISREFNKVVVQMFGGGEGRLELKDDSEILETDIAIIVQPPGKKLQNINLLSGGERALTAIALLFAIQNLKPSPFCILDEIEASLDESNTERFAAYLRKLTKHTQFIVITHRRGTMAGADRLYGITMMEKGVSALVSVSLIEDKLDK